MKKNTLIVMTNTIFEESAEDISNFSIDEVIIVYDKLYFHKGQHKQKLALWLACADEYKAWLLSNFKNITVTSAKEYKGEDIHLSKNTNYYMYKSLDKTVHAKYSAAAKQGANIIFIKNKSMILSENEMEEARDSLIKKKNTSSRINIRHSDFYRYMRFKKNILMENGQPEGGIWSYDQVNRQKFNLSYTEMDINGYVNNTAKKAIDTVNKEFSNAIGSCEELYYPSSFSFAKEALDKFIKFRLRDFGKYQDAISATVVFGEHANISAIMNIGLITPGYVIGRIIHYYSSLDKNKKEEYIASVEGILRQIIGWREYMRFVYHFFEKEINSSEYLEKIEDSSIGKIHKSWYTGTTGIFLFDNLIRKILKTGYAHHIERLMIINNAMIMYGFSRKEIYKWFMSMFVDSYDWVMTGCVSMNHNSLNDRVRYMSRVYLAGDNYIKKMSDYKDKDSIEVMKTLFKSFARKHSGTLKSDYNMASYIARHVKN